MRFLGTGAGQGTPNPFCSCHVCENARKIGGKEIRTRSSFRLNDRVIIDISADFVAQAAFYHENFYKLEHVLYTHSHSDHFNFMSIWERKKKTQQGRQNS